MSLPAPQLLDLPTGRLAYRRAGQGPSLLLIHGWGGSSRYWIGAFALLTERYDLIAVDLPGCGASSPPPGPATLAQLAQSVIHLTEALELQQPVLVGHSLGAAVALLVAAARPTLARRLSLVSFGLPRSADEAAMLGGLNLALRNNVALWSPWLVLWSPWLALFRPWNQLFWTTPPLPVLLASAMVNRPSDVPYAAMSLGVADLATMDVRVALETASTTGDPSVGLAASQVQVPTLVISGRNDPLFPPAASAALAQALPDAGLVLLDSCGHVPMAERPAAFYATLDGFVAP
ncbi:MAG: alpha/beta fold hydrolase [Oscillochloridaceae bacterium umkhey_bin13]